MNGPEHYRRAEEVLANIPHETSVTGRSGVKYRPTSIHEIYLPTIALAQVHATLAATAPGHSRADELAWSDVAGANDSDGG